ncbi:MAG: protease pro-enzyme activation domain-containing protein [Ktedonobacteraceae bacterium]
MKLKYRGRPWFPIQLMLGMAVIGLLVSACSLTGTQTNNTNTGVTPTSSTRSHPVASQPTVASTLPPGTQLPENEVKPLTFNLIYNDTAMEQDIAQMYTSGSPTFHQFLSPDQLVQRYALSGAQQQQVVDWLTQHGFTVDSTDSLHTSLKVHGTVATIERTLNIKLKSFTVDGYTFFMQEGTPTLPQPLGSLVASVVGLDDFALPQFKPPFGLLTHAASLSGNCSNYGAKGNLTRNKLAAAYQVNQLYQQGFQGRGMTIGVAEFGDTYNPQDLANYAACVGITTPQVQNIDVDGHLASGSGQGEAILDLELIAGLAPQAQILDYQTDGQSTSFAQSLVDVFNRVASDHKVQVLSVSYGTYESSFSDSELAAVNQSLRTLAAEGISVFISSGDCGAFTQRLRGIATVSFPASAIYAIAVGGTQLQVNDSNVRTRETAWGAGDDLPLCSNDWGSGGGVSQNSTFKRPSWQIGPGTTTQYDGSLDHVFTKPLGFDSPLTAPNGLRQVPDLAAAAYPNISIYYNGAWVNSGGTSAAAPIVAAGTLLVDQALQQQGKTAVGSVPEFYTLANRPGSQQPYTDITVGDNLFYNATPGWDYTTGWGSPNFNDILQIELSQ